MRNIERAKSLIRDIQDYPKQGIVFKDITPALKDPDAFCSLIDGIAERLSEISFDYVVGIEARGFIIGSALAYRMKKGLILVRKKGKLPYEKISRDYDLEYGKETMEMHSDSVEKGSSVVIVDDLLATGGTSKAAAELIKEAGGEVKRFAFLIELEFLKGREKLGGDKVISLIKY